MRKVVNLRLPVLLAFAMFLGIICGCFFQYFDISPVWLGVTVAFCALLAVILALTLKKHVSTVVLALVPLFFIGGCLNCFIRIQDYDKKDVLEGKYYIYGTVAEKVNSATDYIIIENATADGEKLGGKVRANLHETYGEFCDVGYKVGFYAYLSYGSAFAYGELTTHIKDNVKYVCSASDIRSERKFNLFNSIRLAVRDTLFDNLDYDTASVCYGMITGNTDYIADDMLDSFRYGGIAHIFAVSGLHIGLIFGLMQMLTKRAGRWASAAICIIFIFIYAGICGFSPSSVRACIMCTVAVLAKFFAFRYDRLNSLAFAVLIILLFSPFEAFNLGFRLSVCAIGGICCFSKLFEGGLRKIKIPNKISSAVGVSFGAQLGTMPLMLSEFGYLSGVGLTLNLIFIPVISIIYSLIFVCTVVCTVFGGIAGAVMPVAVLPLEFTFSFIVGSGFDKALITGFGAGIFVPLYFFVILCLSDKINFTRLARIISIAVAAISLTACSLCLTFLPVNGYKIIVSGNNSGGKTIFKNSQGSVLIINELAANGSVPNFLNGYYSANLDAVIILGSENGVTSYDKMNLKCKDVYLFSDYLPVSPDSRTVYHYEKNFNVNGIEFFFIDGYSITAICDGVRVCICEGSFNPFGDCNLLISKTDGGTSKADIEVYYSLKERKYNNYEYGDLVFKARDGKIKKTSINPSIYK